MANQNTVIYAPSYYETLNSQGQWSRIDTGNKTSKVIQTRGQSNGDLRRCSPYSAVYSFAEYGVTGRAYRRTAQGDKLYEIAVGPKLPTSYPDKLVRQGSLADAQRGLYGQTLNVAMTAKDLIDANKMAVDWFRRMSSAAPFLRKKQWGRAYRAFFKGTKSVSKNACNSWLEFQFGVMPTKQSVQEAYTTYANSQVPAQSVQVDGVPSCLRLMSRSRTEYVQRDPTRNWTYPLGFRHLRYQSVRYLSKDDIRSALYRFNLFEVAWDMTPWSFAVDWFIPVGDWLRQFGYLSTTHTDGCDTSSTLISVHGIRKYDSHSTTFSQTWEEYDSLSMSRVRNATLEYTMSLSEMLNKSALGLSCKRTVSAFSLCRQRFSGRGWW